MRNILVSLVLCVLLRNVTWANDDQQTTQALRQQMDRHADVLTQLRRELEEAKQEQTSLVQAVDYLLGHDRHTRQVPGSGNQTAFYAKLSHDIRQPSEDKIVEFDNIIVNQHSDFNHHGTGIFHCSVNGTYFITWTVTVLGNQQVYTELMRNTNTSGWAMATRSSGDYGSGTGSAVLVLEAGDDVFVKVTEMPGSTYHSRQSTIKGEYTTIAGFRVI